MASVDLELDFIQFYATPSRAALSGKGLRKTTNTDAPTIGREALKLLRTTQAYFSWAMNMSTIGPKNVKPCVQ